METGSGPETRVLETVLRQTRMVCTQDNHHKEYVIELVRLDLPGMVRGRPVVDCYRVRARYGRIGSELTSIWKTNRVSHGYAVFVYDRLIEEKRRKGYDVDRLGWNQLSDRPAQAPRNRPENTPGGRGPAVPAAVSEEPPSDHRRLRL
jgi:predicted DNA-binding WGR domain protein